MSPLSQRRSIFYFLTTKCSLILYKFASNFPYLPTDGLLPTHPCCSRHAPRDVDINFRSEWRERRRQRAVGNLISQNIALFCAPQPAWCRSWTFPRRSCTPRKFRALEGSAELFFRSQAKKDFKNYIEILSLIERLLHLHDLAEWINTLLLHISPIRLCIAKIPAFRSNNIDRSYLISNSMKNCARI